MKLINKIAIGLLAIVASTGLSNASMSVGWTDLIDGVVWDHDGTAAAMDGTWAFKLIADMDGDIATTHTSGSLDTGDEVLQTAYWVNDGSGWGQVVKPTVTVSDTYAGKNVYFMFFNTDSSYCGYIYNTTTPAWTLPAVSGDSLSIGMELGTPAAGGDAGNLGVTAGTGNAGDGPPNGIGWQANIAVIPEPTSMALFGLGGLLIGLRRKMRKA